jgi:hypothetical protein
MLAHQVDAKSFHAFEGADIEWHHEPGPRVAELPLVSFQTEPDLLDGRSCVSEALHRFVHGLADRGIDRKHVEVWAVSDLPALD